jgi:hypothetical protein
MYSANSLVAPMNLRHGDPVVRVQRLALAVAMMLSSSNVSPMTTILASLLFAALAGWARAHNWTRSSKTFSWGARMPLPAPCAQTAPNDPIGGGAHREAPTASEALTADMWRIWAAQSCSSHMLFHSAPAQVT